MTSKQKVLAKYPEADTLNQRMMGVTFYIVVVDPYKNRSVIGEAIRSASKAWTNARKNMDAGKEPYRL
jgi:hypothetical protein